MSLIRMRQCRGWWCPQMSVWVIVTFKSLASPVETSTTWPALLVVPFHQFDQKSCDWTRPWRECDVRDDGFLGCPFAPLELSKPLQVRWKRQQLESKRSNAELAGMGCSISPTRSKKFWFDSSMKRMRCWRWWCPWRSVWASKIFNDLASWIETSTIENQSVQTQNWPALVVPFHQFVPKSIDSTPPWSECDGGDDVVLGCQFDCLEPSKTW